MPNILYMCVYRYKQKGRDFSDCFLIFLGGPLVFWSSLVAWSFGVVVLWSPGPLVPWSSLVPYSSGLVVL